MKTLFTKHNNIDYEFRLLEAVNVVEVFKDSVYMYVIKQKRNRLICNCPSGNYRGKCWHSSFALGLYSDQCERIMEPWTVWAEEAGIVNYKK
jgi:hypothetical protein